MPGRIPSRPRQCLRLVETTRLRIQSRPYSTRDPVTNDDTLESTIHRDENLHRSFRLRPGGKPLPLPPSLDPIVASERSQWEQTKKRPNVAEFTPFQKKLWENPYAHALASPVRQCRATSILLPEALLTSLHPRPHPVHQTPWLLPVSLTTSQRQLGSPHRFLNHKYVTAYLTSSKRSWARSVSPRLLQKLGRKSPDGMIWREDMPDLIQTLLRDQLLAKLRWAFSQPGQLIKCASPLAAHIEGIDAVSSVLCLESLKTPVDDAHAKLRRISYELDRCAEYATKLTTEFLDPHKKPGVTHRAPSWYGESMLLRMQPRLQYPPLEYKTTQWRGRKVAVYSLADMMGEESVKELVQGSPYEGEKCLVMRTARHNVPVEMLLMRLASYLAQPGP